MLAAGAARSEDVGADVVGVDLDRDRVLDLGGHLDEDERRVPAMGGVERADPDEAMDAVLALEEAVGPRPRDADGGRLDARLIPHQLLEELDRHRCSSRPAQVHAQEHLRPVLGVGPAGAGVDADQGDVVGVRVAEEQVDLAAARSPSRGR